MRVRFFYRTGRSFQRDLRSTHRPEMVFLRRLHRFYLVGCIGPCVRNQNASHEELFRVSMCLRVCLCVCLRVCVFLLIQHRPR